MPGPSPTDNYIGGFNFLVTVEGFDTQMDGFLSCSGIKSTTEVYDFKHGMDTHIRKAVGRTQYEPVTLERAYSGLDEFALWRDDIEAGKLVRRWVVIDYVTSNRTPVSRFVLLNAFPAVWETPDLDANSSDVAVEKIELEYERVLRLSSGEHLGTDWWKREFRKSVSPHAPPEMPAFRPSVSPHAPPDMQPFRKSVSPQKAPDIKPFRKSVSPQNYPDWVTKYG